MMFDVFVKTVLFLWAAVFPFIGFLIPAYSLRKNSDFSKESFKINLFTICTITAITFLLDISFFLVYAYLFIFYFMEILFIIFDKIKTIKCIDKIFLSSLLITTVLLVLIYLNKSSYNNFFINFEKTLKIYMKDDLKSVSIILKILKDYFIFSLFFYIYFLNFFLYLFTNKNIQKWSLTYYYLIIFIICTLTINLFKFENSILLNLILMIKLIYSSFGLKELYYILKKRVDIKIINFMIISLIFIISWELFFIFGAFQSLIKEKRR